MVVVCEKVLRKEKTMSEICSNCQWDMWLDKCLMCGHKKEKKEWVGLTDEEILEEYRQSYGDDGNLTDVYFARAIESKLKEKNT
jgi:hypothetical protein